MPVGALGLSGDRLDVIALEAFKIRCTIIIFTIIIKLLLMLYYYTFIYITAGIVSTRIIRSRLGREFRFQCSRLGRGFRFGSELKLTTAGAALRCKRALFVAGDRVLVL